MKLVFVGNGLLDTDCYPTPNQGGSVQTWGLARELAKKGHDTSIISRSGTEGRQIVDCVSLVGVKFKGSENLISAPFMSVPFHVTRILSSLYFSTRTTELLRKIRPDIICILDMFSGILPSNLDTRKIYVMHVPDGLNFFKAYSIYANELNSIMFYVKQVVQNSILLKVDRIVVLSSFIEEHLKQCGFKNVVKIPNGINPEGFRDGEDKNYILYAGRFDWNKNVCSLVRVFAELKDIYPDYRLYLVGAGPEELRIRQMIIEEKLQYRVIIFPWLPRQSLLEIMSNCSVLALPSLFEAANPVVVLEAMASAKPIISRSNIGTRDIVDHCKNGYLYNNESELRRYLELLLSDRTLRKRMGQNGRKTIEEKYDFRQIANEYEELFCSLLR